MHRRPGVVESVDSDENKLYEVGKHSFGIILVYVQTTIGIIIAIGLAFFLLPSVIDDTDSAFSIASLFSAVSVFLAFLLVLVTTIVYRQNRLIVTDRNITQVLQYGLFNRKVSQLNIVNIEDVTSVQNGFLSTMMNYGTLHIETAGEQSNFHFTFCPNSNYCAKLILDAREKMLGQMENEDSTTMTKQATQRPTRKQIAKKRASPSRATSKKKSRTKSVVRSMGAEVVEHSLEKHNHPKTK